MLNEFVEKEADGTISFNKTVSVGGIGGTSYRDSFYKALKIL